jgi:hypothetical protein
MHQTQIEREVRQITQIVEQLTGLQSRWSGEVKLIGDAYFNGKKPFTCEILIAANLADREARWRTLIHEALHAVSVGYVQADFEANRGWEEGVVEKLQRIIRPSVLAILGLDLAESLFEAIEEDHAFNVYIQALERVRTAFGTEELPFYLNLLKTPIKNRYSSLLAQSLMAKGSDRNSILHVLSAANPVLTRRLP